jgi:integrase
MITAHKPRRRRPNGEGSVYSEVTPAGIRWNIKLTDETGRRVARRYKTEQEARVALKVAQQRRESGRVVLPARHTMGQLFDAWLQQFKQQVDREERSYTTYREYETYIRNHVRLALGAIDCRRLTVKQVEDYLSGLRLSAQTRVNHRIIIRRALNVALKWGWVDQNVAMHTDPIPVRPREVSALSLADAQLLLDTLKGDPLYPAFVVALYTGLRAGELAGLRVEDIDLHACTAHIHQQVQPGPKGEGLRVKRLKSHASAGNLDLIPAAVAVLADAIGDRTEGYVWESTPGHPYWPTSFTHALTRALKRAGLPHLRLHDLRHYFVSFLPQLDAHPAVAQKLARHATIGTTMNVYTSVLDASKKQVMGRMHDALQNSTGQSTGRSPDNILRIER